MPLARNTRSEANFSAQGGCEGDAGLATLKEWVGREKNWARGTGYGGMEKKKSRDKQRRALYCISLHKRFIFPTDKPSPANHSTHPA